MKRTVLWLGGILMLGAGCSGLGQTPPPPAHSVESLRTALVLTENAPPSGFDAVAFSVVDDHLNSLTGYRYMVELRFEGSFDDDLSPATGHIRAEVWWDGVAPARRVVFDAAGEVAGSESRRLEAVRIGEDYYLVDSGNCLTNVEETARGMANLEAGSLIGGVAEIPYSGVQAVLNSVQAYRYSVEPSAAVLPTIQMEEDSELSLNGELWVTPERNVVVRYYANLDVSHVRILANDRLVSGQVFIRYDVYDLDVVPNISIPFGC